MLFETKSLHVEHIKYLQNLSETSLKLCLQKSVGCLLWTFRVAMLSIGPHNYIIIIFSDNFWNYLPTATGITYLWCQLLALFVPCMKGTQTIHKTLFKCVNGGGSLRVLCTVCALHTGDKQRKQLAPQQVMPASPTCARSPDPHKKWMKWTLSWSYDNSCRMWTWKWTGSALKY